MSRLASKPDRNCATFDGCPRPACVVCRRGSWPRTGGRAAWPRTVCERVLSRQLAQIIRPQPRIPRDRSRLRLCDVDAWIERRRNTAMEETTMMTSHAPGVKPPGAVGEPPGTVAGSPDPRATAANSLAAPAPTACIELDRFCEECSYNLRTLAVTPDPRTGIPVVRCTECGKGVVR